MKANLRNVFHFLALRDHSHAQGEAQAYAKAVTELLEPHIPGLMGLYREIVKGENAS
jgi:thymidylate synthase ThyX